MILATTALVALGCVIALVLFRVARMQRRTASDSEALMQQFQLIHIPALLNLIDPTQERFLRSRLPHADFTKLRRQRNQVLIVYVKRILANCQILMTCADRATQSPNPDIAAAGRELLNAAFRVRLNALISLASLYSAALIPQMPGNLGQTVSRYSQSQDQIANLHLSIK